MIGPWEIFLVLLVVLVIFGAGRLPTIMGDLAKGVKSFKAGLKDEDTNTKENASPRRLTHENAEEGEEKSRDRHSV